MSTSGGSSTPSGAAGGDLGGTYPNPTVADINGTALGTLTGATSNQALAWNGSAWVPHTFAAGGGVIASLQYAPGTKSTYTISNSATLAAIDSTHLSIGFTSNATGLGSTQVLVRLSAWASCPTSSNLYWAIFTHGGSQLGSTWQMNVGIGSGSASLSYSAAQIIPVSASTAYTWDWYATNNGASSTMAAHSYTAAPGAGQDAGPMVMEIWAA